MDHAEKPQDGLEPKYEVEDPEAQGTSDPTATFREMRPSDEEIAQIERERAERLDPANRPENAEVDNTQRTFDPSIGDFRD